MTFSINQEGWYDNNSVNDELKVTFARSESWIGSLAVVLFDVRTERNNFSEVEYCAQPKGLVRLELT